MTTPTLYLFPISHYCEKARWALEYLGVPHEQRVVAPGQHVKVARSLGLRRGSVPFLEADGAVIQGSADIVTWAESAAPDAAPRLTADATREACLEIERRLDDVVGIHVRRHFYSEAVVEHPKLVRPLLTDGLPLARRLGFGVAWPTLRKLMVRGMDLGPGQRKESRDIVERELDWLDGLLADGREYLVGDTFSRADLAAATTSSKLASGRA